MRGRGTGPGGPGGRFGGGGGRGRGGGGRGFDGPPARMVLPDRAAEEGSAARPAKRVQITSAAALEEELCTGLAGLPADLQEIVAVPRTRRQDHGKMGRPIKVFANHFGVTCTLKQAAHYDVEIENVRPPLPGQEGAPLLPRDGAQKPLPIEIRSKVVSTLAREERWPTGWAFDGKNIFAPTNFLPQHSHSRQVMAEDPHQQRMRCFKVTTKWTANVDISALFEFIKGNQREMPQTAIQALDIALKHSVHMHPTAISLARAVFFPDQNNTRALGGGAEAWLGYQQSLRPCETGLTLNVDIACTAFLQELPVPHFLAQALKLQGPQNLAGLKDAQFKVASKAITGLKVQVTHMGNAGRTFSVKGLTREGPSALVFQNAQEGREMTVQAYFEQRYKLRLSLPNVPCLNVGSPRRPIWLPMEVCKIAKGQRRLKLDERQTAEMLQLASKKPAERHIIIEASINEKACLPQDKTIAAWSMTANSRLTQVNARVLETPSLLYNTTVHPDQNGSWNLRGVRFYQPRGMQSYGIASFVPAHRVGDPRDPAGLPAFMRELINVMGRCGMATPDPANQPPIIFHKPGEVYPGETVQKAFEAGIAHFRTPPGIIFVLLPDQGADLYREVKRVSDSFLGAPSQCFVAKKASIGIPSSRPRDQYCANLALKINAKLDGINQIIAGARIQPWQQRPYIVIGADVLKSLSWMDSEPSIAAVVGSLDQHAAKYSSFVQLQAPNTEMIQGVKDAIRRMLMFFYKSTNKKKPERIIYFRSGLSEGQFDKVFRSELAQMVACCRELGAQSGEEYAPPITYIVAQKRHNTRLLPTDPRNADRSGNVLPGTVVDSQIIHPRDNDFYLNSHGGLLGTSRPTHYHVLFDQNKFKPDQLQDFIYCQCYQFARCTRSVSKVPPAYYAQLAAARGRCMLSKFCSSSDVESTSAASGPKSPTHVEYAPIHASLNTRMYYI